MSSWGKVVMSWLFVFFCFLNGLGLIFSFFGMVYYDVI